MANEKRLISLDEALKATHGEIYWAESQQAAVRSFLVKQPRVDAVEVVRCKDCKHYKPMKPYPSYNGHTNYCCRSASTRVNDDDFCSYGERKEHGQA